MIGGVRAEILPSIKIMGGGGGGHKWGYVTLVFFPDPTRIKFAY